MLFATGSLDGITDGSITVAFRRWRTARARPGSVHRTPAGRIGIDAVDVVDPVAIGEADARRAGAPSAADLVAGLRGEPTWPVFRISFHLLHEPDPRAELAADDRLAEGQISELRARLDRLDRRAPDGPWTRHVLDTIDEHPGTRAADLAADLGRQLLPFKRDVRKLKELGLTESLEVGYRLSPRGRAFLASTADR